MILNQFNALADIKKYGAIWEHGVRLADRIEGEHKIFLYKIFSFYVELFYNIEMKMLLRLRSFSSSEQLTPYLDQIEHIREKEQWAMLRTWFKKNNINYCGN